MKKIILLGILTIMTLGANSECPASKADNTIHVSGTGEVFYEPNVAYVSIGVEDQYDAVKNGQADVNKKINAFLDSVNGYIPTKDIETMTMSIQKKYDYSKNREEFVGYTIRQILKIKVIDFKKIGTVVDLGVKSGLNNMISVSFSHSNPDKYYDQALALAVGDGDKKARIIAKSLGLSRIKATQIYEGQQVSYSGGEQMSYRATTLHSVADTQTPVMATEQTITVKVSLEYTFIN